MSKVTRDQLKDLVKECLVEILSEGLASRGSSTDDISHMHESAPIAPRPLSAARKIGMPPRSQSPALNSTVYNAPRAKKPMAADMQPRKPAIVESTGQITSDPIMSQILADTASTTLQEHLAAESARPGTPSSEESIGSPMDIFEGAQHWAALAFSDTGSKGQKLKS